MNYITSDLHPKKVLRFFEEICAIPHGSFHVDEISDYLVSFAKDRKLKYIQDDAKNVIIWKDGSQGHENADALILQGHMDMVLEKAEGVEKDMEKEPLDLRVDGDILYAEGTTLGGDDGIAVAMMLAALDDKDLVHPPLECVFTVNEEVGMLGADALDASVLKGRKMLNLDSEEEGIFTVGCAGGAEQIFTIPVERKEKEGMALNISISGLKGGHSGIVIGEGRANADLLMGRVLHKLSKKADLYIQKLEGGTKDNAIPRKCDASVLFGSDVDENLIMQTLEKETKKIRNEYQYTDADIEIAYSWEDHSDLALNVISKKDSKNIIRFLMIVPNGLLEKDPNIAGMPQTSLNLGILKAEEKSVTAIFLVRSSVNSQKKYLMNRLKCVADVFDAELATEGEYPAWEYVKESAFRDELIAVYEKLNGKKPEVSITHGGLECGLLASRLKGLDCVSVGPQMEGIHTPDEKLSISSTKRCWDFVKAVLEELA